MKVTHEGYITEAEFGGIKCLMFNFDAAGNARVESLFEEFCYHPRVRITIEDIREQKERSMDAPLEGALISTPFFAPVAAPIQEET